MSQPAPVCEKPACRLAWGSGRSDWLPGAGNCKNFSEWFTMGPESALDGAEGGICAEEGEPRVTGLLLAYEFQGLLDAGVVNTRTEIAGRYEISRARVTQIMSLLKLPDEVQEYLMSLGPEEWRLYSERRLREIAHLSHEPAQTQAFEELANAIMGNAWASEGEHSSQ